MSKHPARRKGRIGITPGQAASALAGLEAEHSFRRIARDTGIGRDKVSDVDRFPQEHAKHAGVETSHTPRTDRKKREIKIASRALSEETKRQREERVFELRMRGMTLMEIAEELKLSQDTIQRALNWLYERYESANDIETLEKLREPRPYGPEATRKRLDTLAAREHSPELIITPEKIKMVLNMLKRQWPFTTIARLAEVPYRRVVRIDADPQGQAAIAGIETDHVPRTREQRRRFSSRRKPEWIRQRALEGLREGRGPMSVALSLMEEDIFVDRQSIANWGVEEGVYRPKKRIAKEKKRYDLFSNAQKEKLWEMYKKNVQTIARAFAKAHPHVESGDLIQEAQIAIFNDMDFWNKPVKQAYVNQIARNKIMDFIYQETRTRLAAGEIPEKMTR